VSGSNPAGQLHKTIMGDARHLGALYSVGNCWKGGGSSGSARTPAAKQMVWWSSARLKWLLQILKERARQLEIRGFESFREAVVHESQRIPGLITLPVFAEQAG
jgi:hypothetical protein